MNLQQVIEALALQCLTKEKDFSQVVPTTGYASDLLSCVMSGAQHGACWITLQSHANIVAVAALLELSAILITEGSMPDEETIAKANEEEITLLLTDEPTYVIAGKLWELGLREN
jgi:hypothetical protein